MLFRSGFFFERDDRVGASCALQAADALGTSAVRCADVFVFVLLARVCRAERWGIDTGGERGGDEALEQVALVLDVIKFHRSECTSRTVRVRVTRLTHYLVSDAAFPRKTTLEHVLHVVRTQPRLSKDASSLLIDLGEAIQASATREEVAVLIEGTLLQETHVRNSCLQALQVRRRGSSFLTMC